MVNTLKQHYKVFLNVDCEQIEIKTRSVLARNEKDSSGQPGFGKTCRATKSELNSRG